MVENKLLVENNYLKKGNKTTRDHVNIDEMYGNKHLEQQMKSKKSKNQFRDLQSGSKYYEV